MDSGVFIKLVRKELDLSQEQFARKLNVSFSTVNRWENGKSQPSQMAKELIYNFFKKNNVDVAELERMGVDE